ncbi:glycosyltransferase family 1 protein [Pedococcus bigeumensis]|uniref:glycosyltransferase family 4 protein n=1 Tax=Pedococcus bigeumensis TaxID=433644 RepID=UPI002FE8E3D0
MRLLLDGFWWKSGPPSGRLVLQSIVRTWIERWPADELLLAVPRAEVAEVRAELGAAVRVIPLRLRPQAVAAALELPVLARRHHADLVLAHNYAPVFGRRAVFLHDVLFMTNPDWFTRAERAYFWPMAPLAARADLVLTSSRSEAARIADNVPAVQAVPVGLGVADLIMRSPGTRPAAVSGDEPFVLSVGRLNVRKNLARTIEAAGLSSSITPQRPLLVVGAAQGKADETSPAVERAVAEGTVRFLGHVSDDELAWLYRRADLFVFLSLDEGFGLPPIEARACGTRVLASDIPVLRETMGEDATYVDPTDVEAIAATMDDCLSAPVGPASPPAASYHWSTTVDAIREALEPIARR